MVLLYPKGLLTWRWGNRDRFGSPLRWGNPPVHIISHFGVTRRGGLPSVPVRATLSAGVKFCHVSVSRWDNPVFGGDFGALK